MSFTQDERHLYISSTSLSDDVLGIEQFQGTEQISKPFCFTAQLLSNDDNILPKKLVGTDVTVSIDQEDGSKRYFSGYVSKLSGGIKVTRDTRAYTAEIVPWLWFLTKRSGCRIFQSQSVIDIIQTIFNECPINSFRMGSMLLTHPVRDYCVQYRESDFDFVSRLMEEEGIYYYFEHDDKKHTMVLSDDISAYSPCSEAQIKYNPGTSAGPCIKSWDHQFQYASGQFTQRDYNFTLPTNNMSTESSTIIDLPHIKSFEVYDYPGEYGVKADGDTLSKVRMEELEVPYEQAFAQTEVGTLVVAGTFKMIEHNVDDENKLEWVVTKITHSATEPSYRSADDEVDADNAEPSIFNYTNDIACIPSKVVFRPTRSTPKPMIHGTQTAVVVGPSGDEIYTDEYGRIKVQFHWDREGKKNEMSSCWIRVATTWAGKKWGSVYLPRIGQEVVVSFIEGDPDRPLVIGSVYNSDQMPPYDLPANKTQSGTKTRSSKGGDVATFNEIRFEDLKGSEELYFHAEKDQNTVVENDRGEAIGRDHNETIGRDTFETVNRNKSIQVLGNHTEQIAQQMNITVAGSLTESVAVNYAETVGAAMELTVGGLLATTVGAAMTETVGGVKSQSIGSNSTSEVGGNHSLKVAKDLMESVKQDRVVNIEKDVKETIGGQHSEDVTKEYILSAKKISLTAKDEIEIKVGKASILMKKNGDITLKGNKVNVKASGDITMKGSKIKGN